MIRRTLLCMLSIAAALIAVGGLALAPASGQSNSETIVVPDGPVSVQAPSEVAANRPGVLRRDEAVGGAATIAAVAGIGMLLSTLGLIVRRRRQVLVEAEGAVGAVSATPAPSTIRA